MTHGTFITFEGVDGSGKSTQAERLCEALTAKGHEALLTREPGGSDVAERIREILLDRASAEMPWGTEVLLYLAGRADHVDTLLRPALERGSVVICDRFLDSTLAYQAWGRRPGGRPVEEAADLIRQADRVATGGLGPELTFLLDLAPGEGLQRAAAAGRSPDRLEEGGRGFLERVREGFLVLARAEPERMIIVDADRPAHVITEEILARTLAHLGRKGRP